MPIFPFKGKLASKRYLQVLRGLDLSYVLSACGLRQPQEQRTGGKPTAPHSASRRWRLPRTGVRQVLGKAQSVSKLCQEGHEVLMCAITREFGAGSEEFQACKLLWPAPLRRSIRRVAA